MDTKILYEKLDTKFSRDEIRTEIDKLGEDENVLLCKFQWVSEILKQEKEREKNLRNKAEIILAFYLGFISIISGSEIFFKTISDLLQSGLGLFLVSCGIFFIAVMSFFGISYLLKIIIPRFFYSLDPSLVFEKNKSKANWIKNAIIENLYVYRNNLRSMNFVVFAVNSSIFFIFLSVLAFAVIVSLSFLKSFFVLNPSFEYIIIGLFVGILLSICAVFYVICIAGKYKDNMNQGDEMRKRKKIRELLKHNEIRLLIVYETLMIIFVIIKQFLTITIVDLISFYFIIATVATVPIWLAVYFIIKTNKVKVKSRPFEFLFFILLFAATFFITAYFSYLRPGIETSEDFFNLFGAGIGLVFFMINAAISGYFHYILGYHD